MILNAERLREITRGTEEITDHDGTTSFFRFTPEQAQKYRFHRPPDFYLKTNATADVRIAFRTDSSHINFDYRFGFGSSRKFGWFDVLVDGVLTHHIGDDSITHITGRADITLPAGLKSVEIYFPWSKAASISSFELDDGSLVYPLERRYKMITYGDSITHGYDAQFPSLAYSSKLSRLLDADNTNKAIAGDTFFPELLEPEETIVPDIVTTAYGTNDWNVHDYDTLSENCQKFYTTLSEKYPSARIFAIAPIWRADLDKETKFGEPFETVAAIIRSVCAPLGNVTVVGGTRMTPHCTDFYSDGYLHPNDLGFTQYAENLCNEIRKYII